MAPIAMETENFRSFKDITYEWGESHEKTNKEPDSRPTHAEHPLSEAFSSDDAVGDGVDHNHGDGGEHAAQVEHVHGVLVVADWGIQRKPPAREEKGPGQDWGYLVPLLWPVRVGDKLRQLNLWHI